jgi:hypothetical protein
MEGHDTDNSHFSQYCKQALKTQLHGQRLIFPLGVSEILVLQISLGN